MSTKITKKFKMAPGMLIIVCIRPVVSDWASENNELRSVVIAEGDVEKEGRHCIQQLSTFIELLVNTLT